VPKRAARAFWKSPVDPPHSQRTGNSASRLFVRCAYFGRFDEVRRIFPGRIAPFGRFWRLDTGLDTPPSIIVVTRILA
jgi:hypothetical protein